MPVLWGVSWHPTAVPRLPPCDCTRCLSDTSFAAALFPVMGLRPSGPDRGDNAAARGRQSRQLMAEDENAGLILSFFPPLPPFFFVFFLNTPSSSPFSPFPPLYIEATCVLSSHTGTDTHASTVAREFQFYNARTHAPIKSILDGRSCIHKVIYQECINLSTVSSDRTFIGLSQTLI